MSFFKNYPLMDELLGAWFCEIDFEDSTDQELMHEYKKISPSIRLLALKKEFELLFKNKDIGYDLLSKRSNVYLENDEEMYEWLHELYGYLFEDE